MQSILEFVRATPDTTIAQCKAIYAAQVTAHDATMAIFDELIDCSPTLRVETIREATLVGVLSAAGHLLANMAQADRARHIAQHANIAITHELEHWRNAVKH